MMSATAQLCDIIPGYIAPSVRQRQCGRQADVQRTNLAAEMTIFKRDRRTDSKRLTRQSRRTCVVTLTFQAALNQMAWTNFRKTGLLVWAVGCSIAALVLAGCGQVITLSPTPTPSQAASANVAPFTTPTALATSTPVPYAPLPTPTPSPTPTPVIYTVQSGDTLGGIAIKYGVGISTLQDVNNVLDPRTLQLGQKLIIPRATTSESGPFIQNRPSPTPIHFEMQNVHFSHTTIGSLWVLGEVLNTGAETLEQVRVGVRLLDGQGATLAVEDGQALLNLVSPGDVSPFAIHFAQAPREFANYQIFPVRAVPAFEGGYYRDLVVENVTHEGERYAAYTVSGLVRNPGSAEATDVQVVLTAYDPLDRVVASRKIVPDHNVVAVGGETTFTAILVPLGGPVERVRVVAQSRKYPAGN